MTKSASISTDLLDRAIQFALEAHQNTPRKGSLTPYILHPLEAAAIIATMTDDLEVISAAVLHDTVEDNKTVSLDQIEDLFGARVKNLVAAETEIKEEDESGKHHCPGNGIIHQSLAFPWFIELPVPENKAYA